MHDASSTSPEALPSHRQLLHATAVAIAVAAVVLVIAVLPAEYGIDPTGIGRRIGLTAMKANATTNAPAAQPGFDPGLSLTASPQTGAVWRASTPPRSDILALVLPPGEGVEMKADMNAGDRMVFTWAAEGGKVNFDMHGDRPAAGKDEFTSYWKGRDASAAHGEFEAPFAGRHGWYWENRGPAPVTINLRTSGFYERLYNPALAPPTGASK